MGLQFPGDERVRRADEMEDLDNLAIARHCAARANPIAVPMATIISTKRAAASVTTASAMAPRRVAQARWSSRSASGTAEASAERNLGRSSGRWPRSLTRITRGMGS